MDTHSMYTAQQREKGFTLLEVIVSLIVLAIGILSITGVFPHITRFGQNSHNVYIATTLAQEKLDELLLKNEVIDNDPLSDKPAAFPGCQRKWWGEDRGKPPSEYLQKVFVTVSWQFRNQEKAVMLSGVMGPLPSAKGK